MADSADAPKAPEKTEGSPDTGRRSFLKRGALAAAGSAALVSALAPLRELDTQMDMDAFIQKHYKELNKEEMDKVLARITDKVEEEYQVRPHLRDIKAMDGVQFAMALNLTRCIGCRRCVHACVEENNQSRSPEIQYIRVLEMPNGTLDMEKGRHLYEDETVPQDGKFYMPVQCHQCANPPCVKVCPVEATWKEPDGIVVIDYDWCIGCRYCEAACPYWARRFNFAEPKIPKDRLNLDMAYLSNRPRSKGVMEKCTFCLQRTRQGKLPACLEACPTGSRVFGNVLDSKSSISQILKNHRVFVLKEDLGTLPRFFYFFES
jgi:molybdopterin-containing oxidoreductase family iron-sulfur binding subunit